MHWGIINKISNGMIIQFGYLVKSQGISDITFPVSFTTTFRTVSITPYYTNKDEYPATYGAIVIGGLNNIIGKECFRVFSSINKLSICWFAIGY